MNAHSQGTEVKRIGHSPKEEETGLQLPLNLDNSSQLCPSSVLCHQGWSLWDPNPREDFLQQEKNAVFAWWHLETSQDIHTHWAMPA